jgi:hypothetical protein
MKNNRYISKKKNYSLPLTDQNFPVLSLHQPNNNLNQTIMEKNMDVEIINNTSYTEVLNSFCLNSNKNNDNDIDYIKPGWIKIFINNHNKIEWKENPLKKPILNENIRIKQALQPMIERWDEYKNNFIDLNGEDDYNYYYKFPNYDYSYLTDSDNYETEDEDEDFNNNYELTNMNEIEK